MALFYYNSFSLSVLPPNLFYVLCVKPFLLPLERKLSLDKSYSCCTHTSSVSGRGDFSVVAARVEKANNSRRLHRKHENARWGWGWGVTSPPFQAPIGPEPIKCTPSITPPSAEAINTHCFLSACPWGRLPPLSRQLQ